MLSKSFENKFKHFEFKNEDLKYFRENTINKSKIETGILNPFTKTLSLEVQEILHIRFSMNVTNVISGSRYTKNNFLLHSKSYSKKKASNSYTISFSDNNETKFGEILEFFEINKKIYAHVNIFKICKSNLPLSNSYFYNIIKNKGLFDRYYTRINTSDIKTDIILCENIRHKCIVVKSTYGEYCTEVKYEFEHD